MAITVLELRYELLYLMTSFCYIAARRVLGFLISAYQPTLIRSTQCYFPCLKSRIMLKKAMYSRCSTSPSAMLQLIRNAHTKLFVGGLSFDSNETVLRDAFSKHGDIIEVRVICDHVTGKSKGYGFVKFASEDSAASALKEMNDQVKTSCSQSTM
ncbi:glycine-rich RNA-binding protein 4, mitochondrial-like isoform X3 [Amaranthus tricolor]|uniref:glycine-rich RNA-binding protein 4, mitochondrial-like isoform X3 n=1 Tax=Amaranthus tricolor TaxID=29722 RepID=UPI00258496D6|nr:glycine-rich RNA-binding protein 4, mitochondrial-like isoform X3 [Amaranthus tricolor]